MSFKRFPENDYRHEQNSYHEATNRGEFKSIPEIAPTNQSAMNYTAPGQIPPRKGRLAAILIVSAILGTSGFKLWDSYIRYESFGLVESDIIGVYSPITGFVTKLKVREGSTVQKGDVVAQVTNTDDTRSLQKIEDEILVAEAEFNAKYGLLGVERLHNSDNILQVQGQIASEEGLLSDLNSKIVFQKSELARLTGLMKQDAASPQEVDVARSALQSAKVLISSKKQLIDSLKSREKELIAIFNSNDGKQMNPLNERISYLKNEKARIQQRMAEGVLTSPANGIVAGIQKRQGEKVSDDPLFSIVVGDTSNLVLFYDPADSIPKIGQSVRVYSPSLGQMVESKVLTISKNTGPVPDQIKRYYSADQKAVKVYLEPQNVDVNAFIVGSIIKRPNSADFFKNLFSSNQ